jgi:hypothetical protein
VADKTCDREDNHASERLATPQQPRATHRK